MQGSKKKREYCAKSLSIGTLSSEKKKGGNGCRHAGVKVGGEKQAAKKPKGGKEKS